MLSSLNKIWALFGRDNRHGARDASNANSNLRPTGPALTVDNEGESAESSKDWLTITSNNDNDNQQECVELDQQEASRCADQHKADSGNLSSKGRSLLRHSKSLLSGALSSIVRASAGSEFVINDDISSGREQLKLPAMSYVKSDQPPREYHYVTEYVQRNAIEMDVSLARMNKCACLSSSDCSDGTCGCSMFSYEDKQGQRKVGRFYDSSGRLSSDYQLDAPVVIRECNVGCACNRRSCQNMVIQNGCKVRLVLFKTKSRGWGIRTLENLKKGTFIGIYSGELISVTQSYDRQDDTYLFNLCNTHIIRQRRVQKPATDEAIEGSEQQQQQQQETTEIIDENEANRNTTVDNQFVCDAKFYGNFTRFINHSCEPNVIGIRTFTVHHDERFPYISFFTNQEIKAGSELTLNYGDNYWLVKCKRDKVYCRCKRRTCRFTKKTFPQTLKSYEDYQRRQQQQKQHQQQQEE